MHIDDVVLLENKRECIILDKTDNDAYVHYIKQDHRLNEWISLSKIKEIKKKSSSSSLKNKFGNKYNKV